MLPVIAQKHTSHFNQSSFPGRPKVWGPKIDTDNDIPTGHSGFRHNIYGSYVLLRPGLSQPKPGASLYCAVSLFVCCPYLFFCCYVLQPTI